MARAPGGKRIGILPSNAASGRVIDRLGRAPTRNWIGSCGPGLSQAAAKIPESEVDNRRACVPMTAAVTLVVIHRRGSGTSSRRGASTMRTHSRSAIDVISSTPQGAVVTRQPGNPRATPTVVLSWENSPRVVSTASASTFLPRQSSSRGSEAFPGRFAQAVSFAPVAPVREC